MHFYPSCELLSSEAPLGIFQQYKLHTFNDIWSNPNSDCLIITRNNTILGFIIIQVCSNRPTINTVQLICINPRVEKANTINIGAYLIGSYLYITKISTYEQVGVLEVAKNFRNIVAFCFYNKIGFNINFNYSECMHGLLPMAMELNTYSIDDIFNIITNKIRIKKHEICQYKNKAIQNEIISLNELIYYCKMIHFNGENNLSGNQNNFFSFIKPSVGHDHYLNKKHKRMLIKRYLSPDEEIKSLPEVVEILENKLQVVLNSIDITPQSSPSRSSKRNFDSIQSSPSRSSKRNSIQSSPSLRPSKRNFDFDSIQSSPSLRRSKRITHKHKN
jgi:hypothetical protein